MLGWIPEVKSGRPLRVLCLGAHADDIEIGCGASILQMADGVRPLDVRWVVFSGDIQRTQEAKASVAYWLESVSQKTATFFSFKDGFFPEDWSAIKQELGQIKHAFEPDVIFTHFRKDLHQDHRVINQLTWNAFRNHTILEYEVPKYDGDLQTPNLYIPLSEDVARAKAVALVEYFDSQMSKHWFCEELFLGLMRVRGMESHSPSGYAEGFHARKACLVF